jgi:RNA ligase
MVMTLLTDVLDPAELASAVDNGHVRVQRHPARPYEIYNYTEACQYAGAWTPVTLACRGLIVTGDTVLARPWPKFFNHSEGHAPRLRPDAPVSVTDKADGSLGILFPDEDGWAVATRGSFTSDQARHATAVLRTRYPAFVPPAGLTVLV